MISARRSGFSLIEALVVLAIGGMALAVIFSIGMKAGDAGFALGRRAMSAADADVAISDLRSIIRSLSVRPPAAIMEGVDLPLVGAPERLEGEAVMERATGCAPQGWAGRLVLTIEVQDGRRVVMCEAAGRRTPLLPLPHGGQASLSYSQDGQTWAPAFETPRERVLGEEGMRSARLFVRLNGGPDVDVVEVASSGNPGRWVRFDADF